MYNTARIFLKYRCDLKMRKTAIVICLLIITGCQTPDNTSSISRFDVAIENLSITSQKLEDLRMEKDIFAMLLDDFEQQKTAHGSTLDANKIDKQAMSFAEWHRDIAQREKDISIEHSLNVFAAHREIFKRKAAEPNQAAFSTLLH